MDKFRILSSENQWAVGRETGYGGWDCRREARGGCGYDGRAGRQGEPAGVRWRGRNGRTEMKIAASGSVSTL